jgi:transcriptional regulator with XRE-family HTH domain
MRLTNFRQCGEMLGMHLKAHLSETGEAVASFAGRVGVDVKTLYRYLSGERFPTPENLRRIREATGGAVTADDFVDQHTGAPASEAAA